MLAPIWILTLLGVALILIGTPIGFALSIATLAAQAANGETLVLVPQRLFNGADSFPLVAIPLFVLAGQLMNTAGISQRLIALASAMVGFIRGGLAHVNIVTSMFFAEMSGSAVADVAALGTVLIPAMKSRGYPANFSAAVTSASGSIAIIIPPSIPMILYAVTAETSITQMFIAGLVPGVLLGLGMMGLSYLLARVKRWPIEQPFKLDELGRAFVAALPSLSVPIIILGGIFSGVFTATESAGVAVLVALVVGLFVHRELKLTELPRLVLDASIQTAVVMLIVAASAHMGSFISNQQVPQRLAAAILQLSQEPIVILLMLNLLLLLIGMVLHSAAAIVMVVPVVLPLIQQAGIDPIHFGIVLCLNLAIGQQTPPVASVLLTTCSIARISVAQVMRVNIYFIMIMALVLLLVTYVPGVSLTLPALLGGAH